MRDLEYFLDAGLGGIGCILFVIAFAALVAFLSAALRVLTRVEPENRRMDPGLVWLNLIPFFNLIWMVVTIERVGESIRNEFMARGRHKKSEYTSPFGIVGPDVDAKAAKDVFHRFHNSQSLRLDVSYHR